jgi:hypothetical protein
MRRENARAIRLGRVGQLQITQWIESRLGCRICLLTCLLLLVLGTGYKFRYDLAKVIIPADSKIISSEFAARLHSTEVKTSFYPVNVLTIPAPEDAGRGGDIALFDETLIFATRDGRFFIRNNDENRFEALALRLPEDTAKLAAKFTRPKDIETVGLKGMAIRNRNGKGELFVAHHHLFEDKNCYVLRLSKAEFDPSQIRSKFLKVDWKPLFDSSPCLTTEKYSFPLQSGGRIAFLSDREVIMTVGDFNLQSMVLDKTTSYGKTLKVDVDTGRWEIFSIGHRNPQGLMVAKDGTIWSTEHGPKGGDELNIIVKGGNYGWPIRTFGTHLGKYQWRDDETPSSHAGYRYPIFSFIPSIGISNLVEVNGKEFPIWQGDLLVSSLWRGSIYRLRVREGRAMYTEKIEFGERIRNIVQSSSGTLYLKTDYTNHLLMLIRERRRWSPQ